MQFRRPLIASITDIDWLDSKHSFNFGGHYRDGESGHGLLLVNNDDTVAPGGGFGTHAHRDMEIVTWVLSGKLEHRDSEGNDGVLYPGLAQRMSAGRGIRHSEMNASDSEPVHFVQMWVLPDTAGVDPGYEQRDINDAFARVSSCQSRRAKATRALSPCTSATRCCGAAACPPEQPSSCRPTSTCTHSSPSAMESSATALHLATGDAARITDGGTLQFTAGPNGAELLVWATA